MSTRLRDNRKNEEIRAKVRETHLQVTDFIYPLFIEEGNNIKKEIVSMPGIFRYSLDKINEELDEVVELGIKSVILFGIPLHKDAEGSESWNDEGIVQKAIRYIKKEYPNLQVIADVCFCEYTDHGHCGVLCNHDVDNDLTLVNLKKQVLAQAKAGVDMVAPSGMMDFAVREIRAELDQNGFQHIPIMGYSVKYCSAYYGPFRDAADSAPSFGDRRTYQMDPANRNEAIKEAQADVDEGAVILMVKPALSYLDIIRDLKNNFDLPIAAYNVSGEYAMIKAAGKNGWIDEQKVMMETLLSIKRAGADIIITYFAKEAARILRQ
ncbi:MAG: porphobilinogen synthase [Flavobacteriales bacterium]|nr:porphobilinogen synthase [Flavobacteriales bacterium]MCW8914025.1 porphobilinogen synthase [Flavobacteriales bacterium]MCW8938083.1 porphobilinogen synthase [Flavobacteriales bacterium]MCW8939968.1 porphobilinogen synthase [Flavobacteriales bacterium]MCW8969399.1 porphobilinogen synthase [Flavobacteriales bacterium]